MNNKQKILIVGASGLIGGYLSRLFRRDDFETALFDFEGDGTAIKKLDIRDEAAVSSVFGAARPSIVIVPAAIPNVELCETNPADTRPTNVEGMKNIIRYLPPGALLIYFSSDYIFDGKNGPYSEDDAPNPLSEYGRQKLEIEEEIKKRVKNYLILRTAVVFGWEPKGKNFVMQVLKKSNGDPSSHPPSPKATEGHGEATKGKEKMTVPADQISNATFAGDIAEAVNKLIALGARGIFNVAGKDVLNRYEFAKLIAKVFNLPVENIKSVKTEELNQKAKRPLNAGLKIEKLESYNIKMSSAEEGLIKMRQNRVL